MTGKNFTPLRKILGDYPQKREKMYLKKIKKKKKKKKRKKRERRKERENQLCKGKGRLFIGKGRE